MRPQGRVTSQVLSTLLPPSFQAPKLMEVRTTRDPAVSFPRSPVSVPSPALWGLGMMAEPRGVGRPSPTLVALVAIPELCCCLWGPSLDSPHYGLSWS